MNAHEDEAVYVAVSEWAWRNVLNAKQRRWVMRRAMRELNKTTAPQQSEAHPLLGRGIAGLWKSNPTGKAPEGA